MNWFWMNIPAALVFVGLWAGMPVAGSQAPGPGPGIAGGAEPSPTRPAAQAGPQITSAPQRSGHPVGV